MGWLLVDALGDTVDYKAATTSTPGFTAGTVFGSGLATCPSTCPNTDTLVIDDETSCGVSSVEFYASGAGQDNEVIWLDANGAAIAYGEDFETDPISATTTVQAASMAVNNLAAPHHFGAPATLTGGFGNYTNGMWFSAASAFVLDSITVISDGPIEFQVRISEPGATTAGAELMLSDTIFISAAGTHQVAVELPIMPGSYFINMRFATGTTGKLHRATGGGMYPYTVANVVSLSLIHI